MQTSEMYETGEDEMMIRCENKDIYEQGISKSVERGEALKISTDGEPVGIFIPHNSPIYGYVLSMLNYDTMKKLREDQ